MHLRVLTLLAVAPAALAQTTEPPPPAPSELVNMTPFEVQADSDKSYGALNSNSLTNFNLRLDRAPISADIMDQAFMNDTNALSVEDLIGRFSAGSGYSTSDPGSSAASTQPLDRNGTSFIQIRGLSAPSQMRDGFLILGTMDNPGSTGVGYTSTWDLERVEVINGPQGLLYGFGGGGGVINMVSKQARLGQPAFGQLDYKIDQYGNKMAQIDYGMGNDHFALRFDSIAGDVGGRRWNIGGPLFGNMLQLAAKVGNTVIRVHGEQTKFNRITSNGITLSASSTANDSRNGQPVRYLLATNQMQTSQIGSGASGAGYIGNGNINWGNVDSYQGWWGSDLSVIDFYELTADSQWTSWLSSRISLGWSYSDEDRVNDTFTFYAPNNTANTVAPGSWVMAMTGSTPAGDQDKPSQNKVIRASLLATNDLFGGKAHSQTMLGADFFRSDTGQRSYSYFEADSNFNVLTTNPTTTYQGRYVVGSSPLPRLGWVVDNGPVKYPLWAPRSPYVSYQGVNYVRQLINPIDPTKKSQFNELGVSVVGGANDTTEHIFEKGIAAVNYTQWFGDKIDSMAGVRLNQGKDLTYYAGASSNGPTYLSTISNTLNFNVGLDYKLTDWLRPYIAFSDSHEPSLEQATDPYGNPSGTATSIGQEAGFKVLNSTGTLSGTIAIYHVRSKNEEISITSTLLNDINPSGLNGRFGSPSVWINVDRESQGVQAWVTATPSKNWRMRFSAAYVDGTIGTGTSYAQVYNDQFHEDSAGNVTYADGTIVYVNSTFNSKQLTVSSTTPGAVPLTVALMNNPTSAYYANPVAINGQINSGSNVFKVLSGGTDPVHGAIATGAVGKPISAIQINPGFTPVGVIPTSVAGDKTTGYPEFSMNATSMYEFTNGWMRGFRLGGSAMVGWLNRNYYYYPNGPGVGAARVLFFRPTDARLDLNIGYSRKVGRIKWTTQLNIQNVFNHYHVLIVPNSVTGYSGPDNATFTEEPRGYYWTNTLAF